MMGILRTLNAFRARDQGASFSPSWKKPREQLHRTSAHQREVETTSALFNPRLVGVIGGWQAGPARWRADEQDTLCQEMLGAWVLCGLRLTSKVV